LDIEKSFMMGRSGGLSVGNKSGFFSLGKDDLLCLLGRLSFFQPILGEIHEDLGSNFILEAIDKTFSEEGICHTLNS
jgi:hypothetical protein